MTTVLHIVPELKPGGVEFYTLRMVDAITRAGARPLVASGPGALLADLNALGGEHIPFDAAAKNWFAWPARARALAKLIDRERVDLVHVGSRVPGWLAVLARRHRPFPLVMNYHGAYSEGFPGKRAYNAVMTKGDVCLASSRFTVEHVRARHPIDPAKLKRIWLGIDPTTFDPACINAKRA
ncbi:MAG: glycosyltransferase, partial [Pseudomonadota bacterium]